MKVRVKINQKEAFRQGFDAPNSFTDFEVDPATLSSEDRDLLANHLDGISLREFEASGGKKDLTINTPTLEAALAALRANDEEVKQEKADREAARQREKAEALADAEECFANRETEERWTQLADWKYNYRQYQAEHPAVDLSPIKDRPEVQAWLAEIAASNEKRAQKLMGEIDREKAKAKAKEDKEKAEAEALQAKAVEVIERLGSDTTRERFKRGYVKNVVKLATDLLTEEFFLKCPGVKLDYPEVDLSGHEDSYEDELPDLIQRTYPSEENDISDKLMAKILAAEAKIKAWNADVKTVPYTAASTRDAEDIPWAYNYGLKLTATVEGFDCHRYVSIDSL